MEFRTGDEVTVVEFGSDGQQREGGRRFPATIEGTAGIYYQVRYADKDVNGGRLDSFYAESGWRAWDGELRWRLRAAH